MFDATPLLLPSGRWIVVGAGTGIHPMPYFGQQPPDPPKLRPDWQLWRNGAERGSFDAVTRGVTTYASRDSARRAARKARAKVWAMGERIAAQEAS